MPCVRTFTHKTCCLSDGILAVSYAELAPSGMHLEHVEPAHLLTSRHGTRYFWPGKLYTGARHIEWLTGRLEVRILSN